MQSIDTIAVRRQNWARRAKMDDPELRSLRDAAQEVGCSVTALYKAVKRGDVPGRQIGTYYMVRISDVRTWWNRDKHPGGRPKSQKT